MEPRLYSVETSTGASSLIGSTGIGSLSDIAISDSGDLYEIQDFATSATGVFSASSGISQVSGATSFIPEPSHALLSALGLIALVLKRRR